MQIITLILILIPCLQSLTCPAFTDHTPATPTCRPTCPPGSTPNRNKCLSPSQYLIGQQVHVCRNGWTDGTGAICCRYGQVIRADGLGLRCGLCRGRVYGRGRLCCGGGHYADFTVPGGRCVGLGTGACAGIGFGDWFRVCCPAGRFYHVREEDCVEQGSNNCDAGLRVCCSSGQKLQYIQNQGYKCVDQCDWAQNGSLLCRKRYCNSNNQPFPANPITYPDPQSLRLSLQGVCCYGRTPNNTCLPDNSSCNKRFSNLGWSMCCRSGQFYSPLTNTCSPVCSTPILLNFFCSSSSTYLTLPPSSPPLQTPITVPCNNIPITQQQPYCCPPGFFLNDSQGCRLCSGRVFKASTVMLCCRQEQVYDAQGQRCVECEGSVNAEGNLCCRFGQYFGYGADGEVRCVDACEEERLWRGEYCCEGLVAPQCSVRNLLPTTCNPAYYIQGACQACPNFCPFSGRNAQLCTADGSIATCRKDCSPGTVYAPQFDFCLSCDTACAECTLPFDSQFCIRCSTGFTSLQGRCQRCSQQCRTCSTTITSCTSCVADSSRPILLNSRCVPYCGLGRYFQFSNATCSSCHQTCLECTGLSLGQCTKCPQAFYLSSTTSGQCLPCSPSCLACMLSPTRCYQCRPSFVLDTSTQQCLQTCPNNTVGSFNPSLNHNQCLRCHPSCNGCVTHPQNCLACALNTTLFLSDSLGLNLCQPCPAPCLTCTAVGCLTCPVAQYPPSCLPCHPSCLTCSGPSPQQCLSCLSGPPVSSRCPACSPPCLQCSSIGQICLACHAPLLLFNGSCVAGCPRGTYAEGGRCEGCLVNCSECVDGRGCTGCQTGWVRWEGQCLRECPEGWELRGSDCVRGGNNTNNNTNNNNTNNSTNNNSNNNTNNNNTNTTTQVPLQIQNQSLQIQPDSNSILVTTTVLRSTLLPEPTLFFFLVSKQTNTLYPLPSTRLSSTPSTPLASPLTSTVTLTSTLTHRLFLPTPAPLRNSLLLTSPSPSPSPSSYPNPVSPLALLLLDYSQDPLAALQYLGLGLTILVLLYALASKLKGHFLAQESNTLVLHFLNFVQVVYLFRYTRVHQPGMYYFLAGFGYAHGLAWPNFFRGVLEGYKELPAQRALLPDGNYIRNAGAGLSYLVVWVAVLGVLILGSYLVYRFKELDEPPQIRKIARVGILAIQIPLMNLFFSALVQLIQPSLSPVPSISTPSRILSILTLIVVPLLILGIGYHFYHTYNSDTLQHYSTLRQLSQSVLSVCQSLLLCLCIGKPLLTLLLLPMQLIWLGFNYALYRYGQGYGCQQYLKFWVVGGCVGLGYLGLGLGDYVGWVVGVVGVMGAGLVLGVYGGYQIVGLYYGFICGGGKEGDQAKEGQMEGTEV